MPPSDIQGQNRPRISPVRPRCQNVKVLMGDSLFTRLMPGLLMPAMTSLVRRTSARIATLSLVR